MKRRLGVLFGLAVVSPFLFGALPQGNETIFGVSVTWQAEQSEKSEAIRQTLTQLAKEGKEFLDPDCRWRKPGQKGRCENRFRERTRELDQLAAKFREETLGYFDVGHDARTVGKRDFGGLWEGFALDKLRKEITGSWLVDVAGDILVTSPFSSHLPIVITDAVFDEVHYASVKMERGIVATSVSKRLGGLVRVPDALGESGEAAASGEILKIVLFASPELSGARAHAWATAAIAGGKKVLTHLKSLEPFAGKWAYFYFLPDGTPVCSERIRCQLIGANRTVEVAL